MIRSSHQHGVCRITLNRPDRHNSLVPQLLDELGEAVARAEEDPATKVAVLTAAGDSFSTGGDLAAFAQSASLADYGNALVEKLHDTMLAIMRSRLPFLCGVAGQVNGGALGLVLACDIIIVTRKASFKPFYTRVGFAPDGGWTALLPAVIGPRRAAAVQILNQTISARQALNWGLAWTLCQPDALEQELDKLAQRIRGLEPGAVAAAKQLLTERTRTELLVKEQEAFAARLQTREARDGLRRFLNAARSADDE